MNQRFAVRIIPILVGTIGIIFALYAGWLTGKANYRILTAVFGSLLVIVVCLWLRTRIWLLIPLCWSLTGNISVLPLPFSVRDLSVMLVATLFGAFFALKMIRLRSAAGWLEILALINVAYVGSLFLRHPVGTSAFGSDMVGGRPYFDIAIALVTFLIFRLVIVTPAQIKVFPFFLLGGTLLVTGLNVLVRYMPALVPIIAPLYSGINVQGYMEEEGYQAGSSGPKRYFELAGPGASIIQILCSYFSPISSLLPTHPIRMLLMLLGTASILLAGYRNAIVGIVAFFLFASYFHNGSRELTRAVLTLLIGFVMLIVVQLSIGLPLQAQRALSFVPFIPWNEQAIEDAAGSTQWRVEMWKMVLQDKKYIKDKIFGDGFGFTAYEYHIMRDADLGGQGFIGGAQQEAFMINGAYHSGPLSSIRYGGAFGLALLMIWFIYLAAQAPKLIKAARGTPFFATTLYLFMPIIYSPFLFLFIFGAYDTGITNSLFSAGMFRMISNSLNEYKAALAAAATTPDHLPGAMLPGALATV